MNSKLIYMRGLFNSLKINMFSYLLPFIVITYCAQIAIDKLKKKVLFSFTLNKDGS